MATARKAVKSPVLVADFDAKASITIAERFGDLSRDQCDHDFIRCFLSVLHAKLLEVSHDSTQII